MSFSPPSAEVKLPAHARRRPIYTVLEMFIIAAVLGIVAMLVVPRYTNARTREESALLREELQHLRTQILLYRAEHMGTAPGFPDGNLNTTPSVEALIAQLTLFTDLQGRTSPVHSTQFRFGPYLAVMPENPFRRQATIRILNPEAPMPAAPRGDEAWIYQPRFGLIAANLAGEDEFGVDYFDY